jgi:hypothetical protein
VAAGTDTETQQGSPVGVTGELVTLDGGEYYRIDGVEKMAPFLMTVVSDADLWMFVSSTGALTAGRVDADHALFPYETDDRIHRAAGITGPITLVGRTVGSERQLWQPFARVPTAGCRRSIAKSVLGNRLVFEERRPSWGLTFRATWAPSDTHGWVRTAELRNDDAPDRSAGARSDYEVLDGLLDVMPAGVDALTEQIRSNLVNAYKRSETGPWGPVAVYSLESLISDRAEPVEALTATVVWSTGLDEADLLLDASAVDDMIAERPTTPVTLVTGRPGAYLLRGAVSVSPSEPASWTIVADTALDHAGVHDAVRAARSTDALDRVAEDIALGSERLRQLLGDADAFQHTGDRIADAHHLSNVLFNCMRGGVFPFGLAIPVDDFATFVADRNRDVSARHGDWFGRLGASTDVLTLRADALATGDPDLIRLVLEYLPLTFSRRHGDPSRPWNRFSINVRDDHGDPMLAYEGNWRDIFQNWEALLQSFPSYFVNVVAKFVDATTIDGYNPYRISRDGIDWEVPDPDDPWSHIGYWGDHQIVYLMRLLEMWDRFEPGARDGWLTRDVFVHADVPYALADHDSIVSDPRDTITYDTDHAAVISAREDRIGADGRLLVDTDGFLLHVGLLEKLLVPALGKLTNFVPDGGIWLNTQRPEWNDANNALAGPGLSMVTLYHLRRYLALLESIVETMPGESVAVTASVAEWLDDIRRILGRRPAGPIDDVERRTIVDLLGRSGESHRGRVRSGVGSDKVELSLADVRDLCTTSLDHLDVSIAAGRRVDGLYHSYNRVSFPTDDTARVDHLGPMLEGQVAVLSSGVLEAEATLGIVDALFASGMHRTDLDTFLLYPPTELRPFLERNVVPVDAADRLRQLAETTAGVDDIVAADADGRLHFRPDIVNARTLERALDRAGVSDDDRAAALNVYEAVFDHRSFTGRSGSMYGYEGIGSVYWHMVAKLLLAVQEAYWDAVERGDEDTTVTRLAEAYRRVRAGFGHRKTPTAFGAIPTDCYSHTPAHAGAQQPGMTGQVKEEVLTRFGELGFHVADGRLLLAPGLIAPDEVLRPGAGDRDEPAELTVCGVPMTIETGSDDAVVVERVDGARETLDGLELDAERSRAVFARGGTITRVRWIVGMDTMSTWRRRAAAAR